MGKTVLQKRTGRHIRACWILLGVFLFFIGAAGIELPPCHGQEPAEEIELEGTVEYQNPDTGYRVLIEDWAGLLTGETRLKLLEEMKAVTAYGNAAFVSVGANSASTESFARTYYMGRFGTDSGTVFVVDMDNRNIWIHSDGGVYKAVTKAYAETVTDNVYPYASRGDYYGCARAAFEQITALLEGERIAQPMKYISNGLLALTLAFLINFGLVIGFTRLPEPGAAAVMAGIHRKFAYTGLKAVHTHQTRVYDPVSRGSGGSGGGRSGGGRSGGGGGHRF